jgi:hypothetical protein
MPYMAPLTRDQLTHSLESSVRTIGLEVQSPTGKIQVSHRFEYQVEEEISDYITCREEEM